MGISGTGVRNNFTTADAAMRKESVNHIKEFVEVAAKLGAPVIRVFADTQMRAQTWQTVSKDATRAHVQEWIADDLRECAEQGKKFGVRSASRTMAISWKLASSFWTSSTRSTQAGADPSWIPAITRPQTLTWILPRWRPRGELASEAKRVR